MPFSFLLPRALGMSRRRRGSDALWIRAALGFFAGGGLAFVLVPTHEMRYFLPLAASAGIVFGLALADVLTQAEASRLERVLGVMAGVLGVLVVVAMIVVRPSTTAMVGCAAVGLAWLASWRSSERPGHRMAACVVAVSVLVAIAQALVVMPRRAETRDLSDVATTFRQHIPLDTEICTLGPADRAGKWASLFTYLERRVYVVKPPLIEPGSLCLLAEPMWKMTGAWEGRPELDLDVIAEVEHDKGRFRLARVK